MSTRVALGEAPACRRSEQKREDRAAAAAVPINGEVKLGRGGVGGGMGRIFVAEADRRPIAQGAERIMDGWGASPERAGNLGRLAFRRCMRAVRGVEAALNAAPMKGRCAGGGWGGGGVANQTRARSYLDLLGRGVERECRGWHPTAADPTGSDRSHGSP